MCVLKFRNFTITKRYKKFVPYKFYYISTTFAPHWNWKGYPNYIHWIYEKQMLLNFACMSMFYEQIMLQDHLYCVVSSFITRILKTRTSSLKNFLIKSSSLLYHWDLTMTNNMEHAIFYVQLFKIRFSKPQKNWVIIHLC